MRIALLTTELAPGGAERIVDSMACDFMKRGDETAVFSLKERPDGELDVFARKLEDSGIRVSYLGMSKKWPFGVLRLPGLLRDFAPDVLHAHLMHPNLVSRAVKPFLRCKIINTIHIAEKRRSRRLFFTLDRLTFPLCDAVTAVSPEAAAFHESACGLRKGSIIVIPNGSDEVVPASPEKIAAFKKTFGLDGCSRLAGAAGRMDRQKGYDLFLKLIPCVSKLIPHGERFGFVFIGGGRELESLRAEAERLNNLFGNVKIVFPGYRADAASMLEMLDLFLMPSRYEGYGLALAEAFSLGLPAMCSGADSLRGLCERRPKASYIVDFEGGSSELNAASFMRAIREPRTGKAVFSSVSEMCAKYHALYESLLG